jgi:hypothetical protein
MVNVTGALVVADSLAEADEPDEVVDPDGVLVAPPLAHPVTTRANTAARLAVASSLPLIILILL